MVLLTALMINSYLHALPHVLNLWQGIGLGVILIGWCRVVWEFRKGPDGRGTTESCAHFVGRSLEDKRKGYVWLSWAQAGLASAMVAIWWGGGPVEIAKRWGVASPWALR